MRTGKERIRGWAFTQVQVLWDIGKLTEVSMYHYGATMIFAPLTTKELFS